MLRICLGGKRTLARASSFVLATLALTLGSGASANASTFQDVPDLGVAGSHTYVYTPNELYNPGPMLTPVLFVYGDHGYASQDAARTSLADTGLDALAEAEKAVVIVQNPVSGGAWSASDVTVYQDILRYIYGANTAASGKPALSYYRLDYMLGEGAGSTFINQYMTQAPQVNRIAGVATFGGTMPDVATGLALPAYLAGASDKAVSYYKSANAVDSVSGASTFYNSANEAKKVIVAGTTGSSFNKAQIKDAYDSLFRYTCRQGLSTAIWDNQATTEDFTLMERPNVAALGLTQNLVSGAATGSTGETRWYEWIPNEALAAGNTKKYPLVISMHGRGDHEIYEAESNGWINLAAKKKVIVIAPFDEGVSAVTNMIAAVEAKYPIDTSRVYLTGFSMGASNSWVLSSTYPNLFAGIALMSSPGAAPVASISTWNDKLDLPTYYSANSAERDAVQVANPPTFPVPQVKTANLNALNTYMRLNNITPPTSYDFVKYGIFGFPTEKTTNVATKWGFTLTSGTLSNAYGIPLMNIVVGQNLAHAHYMPFADQAWAYVSQFSRDTATNATIWNETTSTSGGVGGTVSATLSLALGAPATFGAFTPGADRTYEASSSATVTSTAGDATLTVDGGRLANGAFSLSEPLQVAFSKAAWSGPVSNDAVTIGFKQHIGATEPLRTGAYSKTLTFTLSTTTP